MLDKILNEVERLKGLKGEDNWTSSVRNIENYEEEFISAETWGGIGRRKIFIPKNKEKYVDLQSSRSFTINNEEDFNSFIKHASDLSLKESDDVRIYELDNYGFKDMDGFCEIGFRSCKLMNYYQEASHYVFGYDAVNLNILIAQHLEFPVKRHDLMHDNIGLELSNYPLVVCYHVLEHLSDPFSAIKKIYNSMSPSSCFHVEIPIEENGPHLNFGHLFPFYRNDLQLMLLSAGFKIHNISNKTHSGGPLIERIIAIKKNNKI